MNMFDKAETARTEIARKGIASISQEAIKVPHLKATFRRGTAYNYSFMTEGKAHKPITNTAIISICTAYTFFIVKDENAARKERNKKVKKADEKELPVPFDTSMIFAFMTDKEACNFLASDIDYKSSKGVNRIKKHIKDCIKDYALDMKIDDKGVITGMTTQIACDIILTT